MIKKYLLAQVHFHQILNILNMARPVADLNKNTLFYKTKKLLLRKNMLTNYKGWIFAILLATTPILATAPIANADTGCVQPVVEGTDYVRCLKEKDVFEATIDYYSFALVDSQGNLITGYEFKSLVDDAKDGLIAAEKLLSDGNRLWGVIDPKGRTVIPFEYDRLRLYSKDLICGTKDEIWGCFNADGVSNLVTPYRTGYLELDEYFHVFKGDYSGIIDLKGNVLIPLQYDKIDIYSKDLICGTKDKRWGCFTIKGEQRFISDYDENRRVFEEHFIVQKDDKHGLINKDGEIVIPLNYSYLDLFSNKKLLRVEKDSKWGVIDIDENIILPLEYKIFSEFDDRLKVRLISDGSKSGYINEKAEIVLSVIYDEILAYSEHYATLRKGDKYGIVDPAGNIVLPVEYDFIHMPYDKREPFKVGKDDKTGFIDYKGNILLPVKYNFIRGLDDAPNYTVIEKNNQEGLVSKVTGKLIISTKYDKIKSIKDGIVIARLNDKYGYLNNKDQVITRFEFDDARAFSDGMALVKKKNKWGYIDKTGRTVIEAQFSSVEDFVDGVARVDIYGDDKLIDRTGRSIIPKGYRYRGSLDNGLFKVTKNNREGIINKKGDLVVPAEYGRINQKSDDTFLVRKEGKWGMIDSNNDTLVPIEYDEKRLLSKSCIALKNNGWQIFDEYAQPIFSDVYTELEKGSLDRLVVKTAGKWGIIDCDGKTLLPIKFDEKPEYEENSIVVTIDGEKYAYNMVTFEGGKVEE